MLDPNRRTGRSPGGDRAGRSPGGDRTGRRANQEAKARFSLRMSLIACGVVLAIVVVAGTLTFEGKVDGSTFTFLLGLVVGYVLTFIRDSIQPPKSQ